MEQTQRPFSPAVVPRHWWHRWPQPAPTRLRSGPPLSPPPPRTGALWGSTASWGGPRLSTMGGPWHHRAMQGIARAGASWGDAGHCGDQGHHGGDQGHHRGGPGTSRGGTRARLGAAPDPGPARAGGRLATSSRSFVCSPLPGLSRCRCCHFSHFPLTYAENVVSA